ncbi:MAG: c(7)-type cytochrome triheme domain-containing protein [Thermodesulfobacteriota bacterium]
MLKTLFKYLFLLALAYPAVSFALPPDMAPAPADWPMYDFHKEPGELKRNKYGLIDPSPDVISLYYLPKDAYGFVDWAKAIKNGVISPKESIPSSSALGPEDRVPFTRRILIKSKLDFMPDVVFPHAPHTTWLKCSNCHPKIFRKKAGGNPDLSMIAIWKGRFCGRCHDRIAFPIRNCFKCHSAPRKTGASK